MFGFLIALAAGFLTPYLDEPVAKPLADALAPKLKIEDAERRLLSFMVALIGAAVIAAFFGSGTTVGIIVGTCLGYFGTRIVALVRSMSGGGQG